MGKRYYCDFCDKSFSDNPTSRRRHFQGISHQRNRKNHYDSFRAQLQLEERMKRMSYMHNATGEEILRSWLAKRPDIVERCKKHGIQVDLAEGELPYQPSDSYFLPHVADSRNSCPHTVQHSPSCADPYAAAVAFDSNVLQRLSPFCLPQARHQIQPMVNIRESPPLLQTLPQSPRVIFRSPVSPVTVPHVHTHSTPHLMQPQHSTPPLVQSQHPAPPLVQSQHPAPPLVQLQHPASPLVQSQNPAPPLVQSQHNALRPSYRLTASPHHPLYHYRHQL